MTNGPNGSNAAISTIPVSAADQPAARRACASAMRNRMKRTPWIHPTIFTAIGMPARYFSGIATPRRMRNETPSTRPAARKRPIGVAVSDCPCVVVITPRL